MPKLLYIFTLTLLIGNISVDLCAASAPVSVPSAQEKAIAQEFKKAVEAHNDAAIKDFIQNKYKDDLQKPVFKDLLSQLLDMAISVITREIRGDTSFERYAYQSGSREVIQELLKAGANPNAIFDCPIMCNFYSQIAYGPNHLLPKEQKDELREKYIEIALDMKEAGGVCNQKIDTPFIQEINKLPTSRETVSATKNIFADRSLKRPLVNTLIDTLIADYVGVPMSEQRKEREKVAAEEEKERAAAEAAKALQSGKISVDAYDYKATQQSIQEAEDAFEQIMKILKSNASDQHKVIAIRQLTEKVVNR